MLIGIKGVTCSVVLVELGLAFASVFCPLIEVNGVGISSLESSHTSTSSISGGRPLPCSIFSKKGRCVSMGNDCVEYGLRVATPIKDGSTLKVFAERGRETSRGRADF